MAPDPSIDVEDPAPDLLRRILQNLRRRPTVQTVLAYGAVGWAALQFVGLVAESHPARPSLMVTALILYAAGFVVVALAAPIVLQGRHPLRSLMVVGVITVSLGAGFVIRGLWSPAPDGPPFPTPDSAGGTVDEPPASEPVGTDRSVPDEPARASDATDVPSDPDAPVDRILATLGARYGEFDEVVEGTAFGSGSHRVLSDYETPVAVRFYSISSGYALNVETGAGSERLDLSSPAAEARTVVTIPTECGERRYSLTATREGETARIRIEVDSAAARRAVERARTLGTCRVEGEG